MGRYSRPYCSPGRRPHDPAARPRPGGRRHPARHGNRPADVLHVRPDEVDALRFAALRRSATAEPDDARACALLTEALALWEEPVLGGVTDRPFAGPAADRLAEARAAAAEELAARGLAAGQVAETAARWALAVGDPARAGELLGVAIARRGALNLGDPEVVATRDGVVEALGPEAADAALHRGRATPRDRPPQP